MSEIARMWATIGADTSGLESGLAKSKGALSSFGDGFGQLQTIATAALAAVGVAITGAVTAVATTGIQFDALKESANVAFTTMLGSGQAAQKMLNELQAFAIATPFEFPDLIRASQRLRAMGFQAQQVIPQLTAIGDAVAAMGGGAEMIDRVTLAIGQMSAKGVVSAEEMRQLTEAGIPAWQILADKIGITVPEAMKQVQARAVESSVAIAALNAGIEERFGGMMAKQSQTWNGIISNIKDGFTQLSGTIMQPFFDFAKEGLQRVANALVYGNQALQKGYTLWQAFGVAMANLLPISSGLWDAWVQISNTLEHAHEIFVALMKPIINLIAKFVSWQDVLIAVGLVIASVVGGIVVSFAPVIATFAAVTAAVALFRWAWDNDFMHIRTTVLDTVDKITSWFFEKSGIWKGTWEETGKYIADSIDYFFRIWIFNHTVGTWSAIYEKLRFYWIKIRDTSESTWQSVKDTFSYYWNIILGLAINYKDRLLTWYHEWADPLARKIENWGIGVKNTFSHMVGYVMGDLQPWKHDVLAIWHEIEKWWTDNPQRWYNDAYQMVMGLWHGFQVGWYEFWDWLDPEFGRIGKRLREQYGIHSPSTVMADIGNNMMAGLAKGINAGKNAVYDTMDNLGVSVDHNMNASVTYGTPSAGAGSASPDVVLMQENNALLRQLIIAINNKNMSVTVNSASSGASNLGALTDHYTGMRAAT